MAIIDDYDKTIRDLISQETKVVNTRMNWGYLIHSLLFTAFWKVATDTSVPTSLPKYLQLFIIIVGVIFSLSAIYSFWVNERAIAFILSRWDDYLDKNNLKHEDFPPVWAGSAISINNTFGIKGKWKKWLYQKVYFKLGFLILYRIIPLLFLLIWSSLAIYYILNL